MVIVCGKLAELIIHRSEEKMPTGFIFTGGKWTINV